MAFFDDLKAASFAGSGGSPAPQPTLITKSITANGSYSASDDSADGYSQVSVSVPNSYTAGDEGKVVQSGALVSQTATSTTTNGTIDTTTNNEVVVAVPNTYAAGDEGKVVSNGALVAQGSDSVTENGTVDTTLISSLLVNVQGGSGQAVKLINPSSVTQNTSEISVIETDNYFFLFGRLYNSSSSGAAIFTFPDSFDVSKIGTFIKAVRLREDRDSANSIGDGIDAQNKTTSIYLYEGWNDYLAVYNKAT